MKTRGRGNRPGRFVPLVSVGVCALALVTTAGCGGPAASEPTTDAPRLSASVVTRGALQPRLLLTGSLEAVESAKIIVPRTPSWQMPIRWMEQDGASVVEGQKVVELDNSAFASDLEQNRLAESKALNDLMRKQADIAVDAADKEYRREQARIQLEKAKLDAAIPENLRARREHQEKQLALAKAEVELAKAQEELEAAREAAKAEIEELRLALEKARHDVNVAEEAIEALTLRAPRDGILVVGENHNEGRKFQTGDTVHVGLAVASIPDLTTMRVAARLSDVDDGRVTPGMRAVSYLDTYPDESFTGDVLDIAPIAKEQGRESRRRAFRALVRLNQTDPAKMRPGMSVRVEVLPPPREDVLLLSRAALDLGGDTPRALLPGGSSVEVRLGPCNATHCVVEQGLQEGQRVRVKS